jgi:hypothetical protein
MLSFTFFYAIGSMIAIWSVTAIDNVYMDWFFVVASAIATWSIWKALDAFRAYMDWYEGIKQ